MQHLLEQVGKLLKSGKNNYFSFMHFTDATSHFNGYEFEAIVTQNLREVYFQFCYRGGDKKGKTNCLFRFSPYKSFPRLVFQSIFNSSQLIARVIIGKV